MTSKERAKAREILSKKVTTAKTQLPKSLATAEATIREAATATDLDKAIIETADQAATDLKLGDIAANQARILSGESIVDLEDDGSGDLTEADVKQMLADFYGQIQEDAMAQKRSAAESAYSLLFEEFSRYGLGSLVTPLQKYIQEGISPAEFTIRLRKEPAYMKRFAANESRVQKGLRALSEAEYVDLEDRYQDIMVRYGLPSTYYKQEKDPVTGIMLQPGFEKLIAGDVSAAELEDRVQTAYNRVIKANPEVSQALKQFYPDISNGDILAYALDPSQAIENIKRKVTAAEIGGAAMSQRLATGVSRAEELAAYGVTGQEARQGYQTVAGVLPRASTLADIYEKQGLGDYTQTTAEQEVFGLAGSAEAERKRKKLSELEQASFSGSSGIAQGALARDRAGAF
jgi:hypothetical protein